MSVDSHPSVITVVARLWRHLDEHRRLFAASLLSGLIAQLGLAAAAVALAAVVGQAAAHPGTPVLAGGGQALAVVLAVGVVAAGVGRWWEMYVSHDLAYVVIAGLRVRVFERLLRTVPDRGRRRRTGDLVTAAMGDVESLEWVYAHLFAPVVVAGAVLGCGMAGLAVIAPVLLLVLVPFAALLLTVPRWGFAKSLRQGEQVRGEAAEVTADIVETVHGLRELVACEAVGTRCEHHAETSRSVDALRVRIAAREGAEAAATELLVSGAGLVALLVTVWQVQVGAVDVSMSPVVLALVGTVLAPAASVATVLRNVGDQLAASARIFTLLDAPDAVVEPVAPVVPAPQVDVLRLEGVRFGYDPDRPVLRGADLVVRQGETVALVGTSGAGKSTTVQLVERFFDPDAGRVLLDGVDLRSVADPDLRSRVAVVAQDVHLFAGTLRDNLALGRPDASEEDIARAVRTALLADLVAELPQGLDTLVGERGATLSGGQRARVAVARALLVRPRLLVLDEAVAHLDAQLELDLHRALAQDCAQRATLVVAHRPSTIDRADRVVHLDDGRMLVQR